MRKKNVARHFYSNKSSGDDDAEKQNDEFSQNIWSEKVNSGISDMYTGVPSGKRCKSVKRSQNDHRDRIQKMLGSYDSDQKFSDNFGIDSEKGKPSSSEKQKPRRIIRKKRRKSKTSRKKRKEIKDFRDIFKLTKESIKNNRRGSKKKKKKKKVKKLNFSSNIILEKEDDEESHPIQALDFLYDGLNNIGFSDSSRSVNREIKRQRKRKRGYDDDNDDDFKVDERRPFKKLKLNTPPNQMKQFDYGSYDSQNVDFIRVDEDNPEREISYDFEEEEEVEEEGEDEVEVKEDEETIQNRKIDYFQKCNEDIGKVYVNDHINFLKSTLVNKHEINGANVSVSESKYNIIQEYHRMFSEYENMESLTKDDMRHILELREKVLMDKYESFYDDTYDLDDRPPELYDSRLVEKKITVDDFSNRYLEIDLSSVFPRLGAMRRSALNNYNQGMNEVVRSSKIGFENKRYKSNLFLYVDDVEMYLRASDPSKIDGDGNTLDPVCIKSGQVDEHDTEYKYDNPSNPKVNFCAKFILSGGKSTGVSMPDPEKFGEEHGFSKRRMCMMCRLFQCDSNYYELFSNSQLSTMVTHSYCFMINVPIGENGKRSFKSDAMLPSGKKFMGITGPKLALDMASFYYTNKHTQRSDGGGWLPGFKIRDEKVFQIQSSNDPTHYATAFPINPSEKHFTKIDIPDAWSLLLGNLNIIKKLSTEDTSSSKQMFPFKSQKVVHLKKEIEFLERVMNKDLFTTMNADAFIKNSVSVLRDFLSSTTNVTNITASEMDIPMNFEHFMQMKMSDFYVVFREIYKYMFWNPFKNYYNESGGGAEYEEDILVRDYPAVVILIIRINMIYNLIARISSTIDEDTSNIPRFNDQLSENQFKKKNSGGGGGANGNNMRDEGEEAGREGKNLGSEFSGKRKGNIHLTEEYLIHYRNDEVNVSNFTDSHFEIYYLCRRLKKFIQAHVSIMEMVEYIINEKPRLINIFNTPVFFDLFIPVTIEYEYSPYDIEHVELKKEVVYSKKFTEKIVDSINETDLDKSAFEDFKFLNQNILDLLLLNLDEMAEWFKSVVDKVHENDIVKFVVKTLFPCMKYFFLIDSTWLGLSKEKTPPFLKQVSKSKFWSDMKFVNSIVNTGGGRKIEIIKGVVSYFHPKDHCLLWSWLLRINFMQEIMNRIECLKEDMSNGMWKDVSNWENEKFERNHEISEDDILSFCDKIRSEFNGGDVVVENSISDFEKKLRKIQYDLYVELHNNSKFAVEMIIRQQFDDKSIFGDGKTTLGFYMLAEPHSDTTLRPDLLPNISRLLCNQNLDLKVKERSKNPIKYSVDKTGFFTCEIRKIDCMVPNQYRNDRHARSYLFGAVYCSLMGLYEHADHNFLSQNYSKIIRFRAEYFSEININGKTLKERRDWLFSSSNTNKYCIRDILRENHLYCITNQLPWLYLYYKNKLKGEPYIEWDKLYISTLSNMNLIRMYFWTYNKLPVKRETIQPKEFKSLVSRSQSEVVIKLFKRIEKVCSNNVVKYANTVLSKFKSKSIDVSTVKEAMIISERCRLYDSKVQKDDKELFTVFVNKVFGKLNCDIDWVNFIHRRYTRLSDSTEFFIKKIQSSLGTEIMLYLLKTHLSEKYIKQKGRGQKKRPSPIICSGIYRLYKFSYVGTMMTIFKKIFQERTTIAKITGVRIPVWLLEDPFEDYVKIGIEECPLLGGLTEDYIENYESIFSYLYDVCKLSLCGLYLISQTIVQYYKKESENKMRNNLRSLNSRDYQILKYYFTLDRKCNRVRTIDDNITNFHGLLHILQRNNQEWVNSTTMSQYVFSKRFGCECEEDTKHIPLNHYTLYTKCCWRITSYPNYNGFGNYRVASEYKISHGNVYDMIDDIINCTCHKFDGNFTKCSIHSSKLVTSGEPMCAMYGKKNKKKRNNTILKLFRQLDSIRDEISSIPNSDSSLQKFHKQIEYINKMTTKELTDVGLVKPNDEDDEFISKYKSENKGIFPTRINVLEEDNLVETLVERETKDALSKYDDAVDILNGDSDVEMFGKSDDDDDDDDEEEDNIKMKESSEEEERGNTSSIDDDVVMGGSDNVKKKRGRPKKKKKKKKKKRKKSSHDDDDDDDLELNKMFEKKVYVPFGMIDENSMANSFSFGSVGSITPTSNSSRSSSSTSILSRGSNNNSSSSVKSNRSLNIGFKQRQKRSSKSVYRHEVGDNLVGKAKKCAGRYYKHCHGPKCSSIDHIKIVKAQTFGKQMIINSASEEFFAYGWCQFCGSFVKLHQELFYGKKYMCESCWYTRPEGTFSFYDHLTKKIVFVKMEEAVIICTKMFNMKEDPEIFVNKFKKQVVKNDLECEIEIVIPGMKPSKRNPRYITREIVVHKFLKTDKLSKIFEKIKISLDSLEKFEFVSYYKSLSGVSYKQEEFDNLTIDEIGILSTTDLSGMPKGCLHVKKLESKFGKPIRIDMTKSKTKVKIDKKQEDDIKISDKERKRAITADLIKFCLRMRRYISGDKMQKFFVIDDTLEDDEMENDTLIKVIQTERRNIKQKKRSFKLNNYDDVGLWSNFIRPKQQRKKKKK